MPNSKNGRTTPRKKAADPPQAAQEQGIPFNSNVLVPDEVIAKARADAEKAQLQAQNAVLNAQLLETRNELIKARVAIDQLAEESNGKKSKSSNDNEDGKVRQAGGRSKAGKSKKG
jgi:hypothetical protein